MPTEITAPLHLRTLLSNTTYLIVDFYATWCPPCKAIAPVFTQLSTSASQDGKLGFAKVNVDEQREVAGQYGIQAMPTFLVFKEGKVVETIKGANPPALKSAVERAVNDLRSQGEAKPAAPAAAAPAPKNEEGLSMLERLMGKKA